VREARESEALVSDANRYRDVVGGGGDSATATAPGRVEMMDEGRGGAGRLLRMASTASMAGLG
jgi:hypothetical protein